MQTANVVGTPADITIQNLPARTVKVGTSIEKAKLPSITSGGYVMMLHAGQETTVDYSQDYTYGEVGQYEWRFYVGTNPNGTLFDTYTVSVTDTTYTMTMPSNVVTVAPKGLTQLELPLPASYTVGGESVEIESVTASTTTDHFAVVSLQNKQGNKTNYRLSAIVSLENNTFAADKVTYGKENITIDLAGHTTSTGTLKVTYILSSADGKKTLVALPLTDITIKDVNKSEVTFANIPTAPSVANLSYYSQVALTAPTADSAKAGDTTFSVEAQTKIIKVQAYLFATEPSKWSGANVHTLTVENGVVKEGNDVRDLLEIDGLNVKIKALGGYRFQFETTTLFGY